MDEQDPPMKRCTGPCGQEYPATAEFWSRNNQQSNGLNPRCKKCVNDYTKDYRKRLKMQDRPDMQKRRNAYRRAYSKRPEVQEKQRVYARDYYYRPEVRAYRNRLEEKERRKEYYKSYYSHPEVKEQNTSRVRMRRAKKRSISGTHTPEQIQDQLKRQKHTCYYCQKKLQKVKDKYIYHIEHTFPISRVAGTDIPANSIDYIVLACPTCNRSKGDKFPWEWPEGGRLF